MGLKPDNQMFVGVLTACSVLGDIREGLLHSENEALEFIEKMSIEQSVEI